MAAFGGSVFEKKHVAKFCHYYILKLHPNVSYNDAMDFIFAKGTKKRSGGGDNFTENGGPLLCGKV